VSTVSLPSPTPNETVEKVQCSDFLKKMPFENQGIMSNDFQVFGFFDSLNERVQATAYSVRSSVASASSRA
jgi:hypothetical protein